MNMKTIYKACWVTIDCLLWRVEESWIMIPPKVLQVVRQNIHRVILRSAEMILPDGLALLLLNPSVNMATVEDYRHTKTLAEMITG